MKSIWKFDLHRPIDRVYCVPVNCTVEIPKDYRILSVIEQFNVIQLYCLVEPDNKLEKVNFWVFGTGWELTNIKGLEFIDTVSTNSGGLIWHVFHDKRLVKKG